MPALVALCAALALAAIDQLAGAATYSIFAVMSGETYFRTGALPWAGLLASGVAAAAMLSAGTWNFARQDF